MDNLSHTENGAMSEDSAQPAPLTISESAAKRVAEIKIRNGMENSMLRVTVSGGGCSGFQYGFDFDTEIKDDDIRVTRDGVTVVTDSMSLLYLAVSEVDFVEDMIGPAFTIRNPNATASCSCGSSFAVG